VTVPPKPSNTQINRRAIDHVVAELERRGGHARVVREGRQIEIRATGSDPRHEVAIQVKARTGGDWQTSTDRGRVRTPEEVPWRFWILVDLEPSKPMYYIVPEWWMQNDIYKNHHEYIDPRGGHRIANDDSVHHKIETDRVAGWRDGWNELGIFAV
jgi:hypothetical protein